MTLTCLLFLLLKFQLDYLFSFFKNAHLTLPPIILPQIIICKKGFYFESGLAFFIWKVT